MAKFKHKRKLKNFLLRPDIQIKMGLQQFLIGLVFSSGVIVFLLLAFRHVYTTLIVLTGARAEVLEILRMNMINVMVTFVILIVIFLLCSTAMAIISTHKLVGPAVAFRRHLQEIRSGRFDHRTILRKKDAFKDLADELNRVSEYLQTFCATDAKMPTADDNRQEKAPDNPLS